MPPTEPSILPILLERIDCPLCGSDDTRRILSTTDEHEKLPGEFHFDACRKCGHRFMNPRPVAESLSACYPLQYGPHQTIPTNHASPVEGSRPWYLKFLPLKYVPGLRSLFYWLMDDGSQPIPTDMFNKPGQALELGCATGLYLSRLQQQGWGVTGVEPNERAANVARSAGLPVLTGTLETCPLPAASVDLAAAWMVLEHVVDPRTTLMQLHQLIKPGGQLLLSVPNAGCWEQAVFGRHWWGWEPPRHLQQFSPKVLQRLLKECGFVSIQIRHQSNLSSAVGSLGLLWLRCCPNSRIGKHLRNYPANPSTLGKLCLAIPAKVLSLMRQGGRLTVSARRPEVIVG